VQIGAYKISGELGRGGQGCVYRASGPDGRTVAVKVLLRAKSAGALARFDRERRMLAALGESAGFVPLLDAGETPHGPFFVMPLLEGGTLREKLGRGPFGVEETVGLGIRLSRSLARAHAQGIVHRDLKPENVLFSRGEAFVSDFGLAKHFLPDAAGLSQSVGLSRTGEMRGTVGYMAPEQARDARKAGPAADVFALGAILYECLAGRPAFQADTVLALLGKVENESPRPVSGIRPETPVWLARVVTQALARDPERRFPDAGALLRALEDQGRSSRARPRWPIFAGSVLVLGALAGGVALSLRRPSAPPSAVASPSSRSEADPFEKVLAQLAGKASVTSSDAPPGLILKAPDSVRGALVARVLERMIVYSLDDARSLEKAIPGPEARALEGLALLGSDKKDQRDEAKRLLRESRSPLALEIVAAAAAADIWFEGPASPRAASEDELERIQATERSYLQDPLRVLKRVLPHLSPEVANDVVKPLVTGALVHLLPPGLDEMESRARLEAFASLDDPPGLDLERLVPRLALVAQFFNPEPTPDPGPLDRHLSKTERLARRLARELPRAVLYTYRDVMETRERYRLLGDGSKEPFAEDVAALATVESLISTGAPSQGVSLVEGDTEDRRVAWVSAVYRREACLEEILRSSPPPPDLVARGLAAAREAVHSGDVGRLDLAGERLLVLALEAGVELESTDLVGKPRPLGGEGSLAQALTLTAVLAERERIRKKPQAALTILGDPVDDDTRAAAALAEADLGNFARARELLGMISGKSVPILRRFRKEAASRYVDEKEKQSPR
jgi:serine/threonine protein kinase